MAISVTRNDLYGFREQRGVYLRVARLDVTGLVASGNNTVPHGLLTKDGTGAVPMEVGIEPTSNQTLWEYQAADATNIYIGAGAGAGTTCSIYVTY